MAHEDDVQESLPLTSLSSGTLDVEAGAEKRPSLFRRLIEQRAGDKPRRKRSYCTRTLQCCCCCILMVLVLAVAISIGVWVSHRPTHLDFVVPLTTLQESAFMPAAMLSNAAYCPSSETATWSCGRMSNSGSCTNLFNAPNISLAKCDAVPGFRPFGAGGDGSETQFCALAVVCHK